MSLRTPTQERREHITIRLESEQARRLREHARHNERTISQELRLAVRQYLAALKEVA